MSNGIEIEGMDEFTELTQDMTISEADEKKAMNRALNVPLREVEINAPYRTGFTKKSIKKYVKRDGLATVGSIRVNSWTGVFTNFGTSLDKSHVGWFDRNIEKTKDAFFLNLYYSLMEKIK